MNRSVYVCVLALCLLPATAEAQWRGYNQAWIEGKYGRDLSSEFEADDWRKILRQTRASGGDVLRVWLFEGAKKEGLVWGADGSVSVDPSFLANVRHVIQLARAEGVRIYWTALTGNWPERWGRGTVDSHRHYNLLNDRYRIGERFRENALGPVLDEIMAVPQAAFALDLMNEVQGSVRAWFWSDGWTGARRFMRTTAAFVHRRAPGLPVTASSGHHTAADDIIAGRFDGVGLDFHDVHQYTDTPGIQKAAALARHAAAQNRAIVVGEFGQASATTDELLQAKVTYGVLKDARRYGFAGAFGWRLVDEQVGGVQFSHYDGDRQRFAVQVVRSFATH